MFAAVFAVIVGLLIVYLLSKKKEVQRKGNVIPGPKGLPLVGSLFEFKEAAMPSQLSELVKEYGEMFQVKFMSDTIVVLNSSHLIHKAYASEEYKLYMNDRADTFFGRHFRSNNQSTAFSSGEIHTVLRKIFHQGLKTYGSGLQKLEENVMTEMETLCRKMDELQGREVDFVNIIQRSLSNVISLVLSGETFADDDPDVDMFWEHVLISDIMLGSFYNFVMNCLPFLKYLPAMYGRLYRREKRLDGMIGKRYFYKLKETHVPGKVRGLADYYIEVQEKHNKRDDGFVLEDHHIVSQFTEVVDAGVTTSSAAILNSFAVLMNYPECQTKIQAELDRVIGRERSPTFADREKCTYLRAFELEVHRYIPVVPLSLPHVCNEHIVFEGYDVQPKTIIFTNVWHVHHDEKVWGDPWNFRPERFLDNQGELLPNEHVLRMNVLPFGTGPRICPGQVFARTRYFLYLASLLQKWTFEFPPDKSVSCDPRSADDFHSQLILRVKTLPCLAKKRE